MNDTVAGNRDFVVARLRALIDAVPPSRVTEDGPSWIKVDALPPEAVLIPGDSRADYGIEFVLRFRRADTWRQNELAKLVLGLKVVTRRGSWKRETRCYKVSASGEFNEAKILELLRGQVECAPGRLETNKQYRDARQGMFARKQAMVKLAREVLGAPGGAFNTFSGDSTEDDEFAQGTYKPVGLENVAIKISSEGNGLDLSVRGLKPETVALILRTIRLEANPA